MSNPKIRKKQHKRTQSEYDKLRQDAYELVVILGKTQKEAASILGITEKTIGDWAKNGKEGKWSDLRKARQSSGITARENVERIIALLSGQRLDIEQQINEAVDAKDTDLEVILRMTASRISDEISKYNKTLIEINKNQRTAISLGVYIDVMDEIFAALKEYDPKVWESTVNFQATHARKKANEL